MRYIRLFTYKGKTIILQDNCSGEGNFPFEYKLILPEGIVRSSTSYNTISCCKVNAKQEIDYYLKENL